jgi:hypothetical protein
MIKVCPTCHIKFEAKDVKYFLCPKCYKELYGRKDAIQCSATTMAGTQCKLPAKEGEKFCPIHLEAGYGLFSLVETKNKWDVTPWEEE